MKYSLILLLLVTTQLLAQKSDSQDLTWDDISNTLRLQQVINSHVDTLKAILFFADTAQPYMADYTVKWIKDSLSTGGWSLSSPIPDTMYFHYDTGTYWQYGYILRQTASHAIGFTYTQFPPSDETYIGYLNKDKKPFDKRFLVFNVIVIK